MTVDATYATYVVIQMRVAELGAVGLLRSSAWEREWAWAVSVLENCEKAVLLIDFAGLQYIPGWFTSGNLYWLREAGAELVRRRVLRFINLQASSADFLRQELAKYRLGLSDLAWCVSTVDDVEAAELPQADMVLNAARKAERKAEIPPAEQNPNGLHQRYTVTKADGTATDPDAVYFVLRLDGAGDDLSHIEACRAAALEYVKCVRETPQAEHLVPVADDLEKLVGTLREAQRTRTIPVPVHLLQRLCGVGGAQLEPVVELLQLLKECGVTVLASARLQK